MKPKIKILFLVILLALLFLSLNKKIIIKNLKLRFKSDKSTEKLIFVAQLFFLEEIGILPYIL
jgi:hypothetical protein